MAGEVKRRSRTVGSKTTTQPRRTGGLRGRSRTEEAPPKELKRRSRTEGGYTPPAPRPTTGLRSRSRTETAPPTELKRRSRTEGSEPRILGGQRRVWKRPGGRVAGSPKVAQASAASTASAAQIAKALRDILRLLGQQPPQSASNGRTSSAKAEAARKRGVPKARVVSPKDMVRGKGVLR